MLQCTSRSAYSSRISYSDWKSWSRIISSSSATLMFHDSSHHWSTWLCVMRVLSPAETSSRAVSPYGTIKIKQGRKLAQCGRNCRSSDEKHVNLSNNATFYSSACFHSLKSVNWLVALSRARWIAQCAWSEQQTVWGCTAAERTCSHATLTGTASGILQLNQVILAAFGYRVVHRVSSSCPVCLVSSVSLCNCHFWLW